MKVNCFEQRVDPEVSSRVMWTKSTEERRRVPVCLQLCCVNLSVIKIDFLTSLPLLQHIMKTQSREVASGKQQEWLTALSQNKKLK